MNSKISVIVPVYKAEKYMNRCIDSIINQSYDNLEIILVDDGSPDACPEICEEYAIKDSRIKVIHQKNEGVSSARNNGINASTGDFIAFVDSDDYLDEGMYEYLINLQKEYGADAVKCSYREFANDVFNDNKKCKYESQLFDMTNKDDLSKCLSLFSELKIYAEIWSYLFKADVIKNYYFDTKYGFGEDLLFVLRLLPQLTKVYFSTEKYYNYYLNSNGAVINKNNISRNLNNTIDVNKELFSAFDSIFYPNISCLTISTIYRLFEKNYPAVKAKQMISYISDFIYLKYLISITPHSKFTTFQKIFIFSLKNKNTLAINAMLFFKKKIIKMKG